MKKIIGIVIIITLLLSGVFLLIQNKKLEKNITILNNKIVELEKQKQELESKPPVGWKEYTDDKYKFRVWYPGETIYKLLIFHDDKDPMPHVRSFDINDSYGNDIPLKLLGIYI